MSQLLRKHDMGSSGRHPSDGSAASAKSAEFLTEKLAGFAMRANFDSLPEPVVRESKLIILDSVGCALAGVDSPKGRIGIDYGRVLGREARESTIIGTSVRTSLFGAAFANAELINALDFDGVLPPGHVTPYVLPSAMALGETLNTSGPEFICAMAVAHEMSYRIGKSMDYLRDTQGGEVHPPEVYGYSSTIFGATAAIARLKALSLEATAHALGIAGSISPVNSQVAWFQQAPSASIKYCVAGVIAHSSLTAAYMAELGHSSVIGVLDDRDHGYARFIGTKRWEPDAITDHLGTIWHFPDAQTYKPYPHCRIFHGLIDGLLEIVRKNDLRPEEIDGIEAWVEGFVDRPVWLNRRIESPSDAQFSLAHGLAVAAHGVPPGKAWLDPDVIFRPSVLSLMDKVVARPHPNYVELLTKHPGSRPARIQISARGQEFVDERLYPKGSKSSGPDNAMTQDEIAGKFKRNARESLPEHRVDELLESILGLENVKDINQMTALMRAV